MPTCPKCKHEWEEKADWREYLRKQPGHKVHFFSEQRGKIARTRLHFRTSIPIDVIRSSLILIQVEHCRDPYFRWCDTPDGSIESVIANLEHEMQAGGRTAGA